MVRRPLPANALCAALVLLTVLAAGDAAAGPCREETFEDAGYIVCTIDPATADLRLFLNRADGTPYGTFDALAAEMTAKGETLVFAMNGGMYRDDFTPVGLHVEAGKELAAANTRSAPAEIRPVPNFYKKPNGVFYFGGGSAGVATTEDYLKARPEAAFATQSGPMLVIGNTLHPAFIPGSTDRKRRNGVGIAGPNRVLFVISEGEVNFHDFARLFRDRLGCADALFLDGGSAPGLYAPDLGRDDPPGHGGYGPIIAVVEKGKG